METKTYPYRNKTATMVFLFVFMAACAAGIFWLVLDTGEESSGNAQNGAGVFYSAMAIVAFLILGLSSVLGLVAAMKSLGSSKHVILGPMGIEVPKSIYGSKTDSIRYAEVTEVKTKWIGKQNYILVHGRNHKLAIAASMLRDKEHFADLLEELQLRCA